uniref:F-box only protein 5-like n=1 Tax=Petromyzon marinus TaxID=7757 RepID=A0AAJ7TCG1_PETMA|nr:F-box only protein 5-like [Petromyzon marinus]XP_032815291.1 F-box only protein 5-like [Petromyzon marinus]XP_032815292.1 F-box only protein 5-like [Petromyzon marinus]
MPAAVPILFVDTAELSTLSSGPRTQRSSHEALFPSMEEVFLSSPASIFMPKIGAASQSRDRDSGVGLMDEDYLPREASCSSSNDKPELTTGNDKLMELDDCFEPKGDATGAGIGGCRRSLRHYPVSPAKKPAKMEPTATTRPDFSKPPYVESAGGRGHEPMCEHSLSVYDHVTLPRRDSNKRSHSRRLTRASLQEIPPGCGTASEGVERVAAVGEAATGGSACRVLTRFALKCSHVHEPSGIGGVGGGDCGGGARVCSRCVPAPNAAHTPALRFAWELAICVHKRLNVDATCSTPSHGGQAMMNPSALVNPELRARLVHLIGRKMGEEHVDILGQLVARDLRHVIQKVLLHLPARDVARVLVVSKQWQEIVTYERKTLRKHWLIRSAASKQTRMSRCLHDMKENGSLSTTGLLKRQNRASRGSKSVGPGATETKSGGAAREPADRASRFFKAARELCQDEHLRVCHRCSWPARCTRSHTRALCTNGSCAYDFCTRCLCAYRGMCKCCATPSNGGATTAAGSGLPGSRRSRRNLQRL